MYKPDAVSAAAATTASMKLDPATLGVQRGLVGSRNE
jgi:hypothetical protein